MNRVELIGRLAADPEIRYGGAANDTAVARFNLAVERRYKKEGQPSADFIGIVAIGRQGEFCQKYLKKGQQIGLCGRIQVTKWTDREGNNRYSTEVIGEEFFFCGKKNENEEASKGFMPIDESIDDEDLPF